MSRYTSAGRIERTGRLLWVPLKDMEVNPRAQREYKQAWTDHIYANFDPERLGWPVVNKRSERFYICDGQHRVEATKLWFGEGWEDQQLQCQVYEGFTEKEEADMFLKLNDKLAVSAYAKFKAAITAEWPREVEIDRVVRANGLHISQDKTEGAVRCVGTLIRIYERADSEVLGQTLRMTYVAFGDFGLETYIIDAMAYVCQRYHEQLNETLATQKLKMLRGGVNTLYTRSEQLRQQMGAPRTHAIAGAIVEALNKGRDGLKLPKWWTHVEDDAE